MFDDRQLVCEGECNPGIRDYDAAVAQLNSGGKTISPHSVVAQFARTLVHTTHISVTEDVYRNGGWHKVWKCATCGKERIH